MVSFCDIPLSQIKEHLDRYGSYGIGLNKIWGIRKKLNPVLYIKKNSIIKLSIDSLYYFISNQEAEVGEEAARALQEVFMYIKSYETDVNRAEKYYRYYNEREWRYIPPSADFINEDQFNDFRRGRELNNSIQNEKLIFEPNDIRYLILRDETEIDELIDAIPVIKSKFDEQSRKRLISRIITSEQIGNDF